VNLEEVLESVLSLYARQIEAKHITVSKQYRVDGTIQSYPGEIRQVFSTLLVNAMEATPKDGRFVLRASTSCDWRNPAIRGMRITLADTGGGISADNAIRIFEPFFTTKGERGTGLGLWVSHGVVHRLGGSIRVRSTTRAGKSGTAFSVFLPHRTRKMDLTPSAIGRLA
jgi:signal transduction histidine kinase